MLRHLSNKIKNYEKHYLITNLGLMIWIFLISNLTPYNGDKKERDKIIPYQFMTNGL